MTIRKFLPILLILVIFFILIEPVSAANNFPARNVDVNYTSGGSNNGLDGTCGSTSCHASSSGTVTITAPDSVNENTNFNMNISLTGTANDDTRKSCALFINSTLPMYNIKESGFGVVSNWNGQTTNLGSQIDLVTLDGWCNYTVTSPNVVTDTAYTIIADTRFGDATSFRTAATKTITVLAGACDWCKNVNVTVYANGSAKTYNPAGTLEGNLTMSFAQYGTNDYYTYNLTLDNSTDKVFNESSNNGSLGVNVILSNLGSNTVHTIKTYWNNGTKFQDFYMKSNGTGYLSYNITGFEYPRYTMVHQESLGTTYTAIIIAVTALIAGGYVILRRIVKG